MLPRYHNNCKCTTAKDNNKESNCPECLCWFPINLVSAMESKEEYITKEKVPRNSAEVVVERSYQHEPYLHQQEARISCSNYFPLNSREDLTPVIGSSEVSSQKFLLGSIGKENKYIFPDRCLVYCYFDRSKLGDGGKGKRKRRNQCFTRGLRYSLS